MRKPTIGPLDSPEQVRTAIRDLHGFIQDMFNQGAFMTDAADPTIHMAIMARGTDGNWHAWKLVSGGGCTITFNDSTHVCTISVP